jgi:hypothetical protein
LWINKTWYSIDILITWLEKRHYGRDCQQLCCFHHGNADVEIQEEQNHGNRLGYTALCGIGGAGMENGQRIKQFNKINSPFYIVDHENGKFSLCLAFSFLTGEYENFGQDAFNRYALETGGPVMDDMGMFTHGSGYEWQTVFEKAFEGKPGSGRIKYDCEAGGFFCYSESLSVLENFGTRFRTVCMDGEKFAELVSTALKEAAEKENQAENICDPARPQEYGRIKDVFTVEVKKQPYGYESFSLPMAEQEMAEAEKRIGTAEYGYGTEMTVVAAYDGLYETLPPGCTIRELNQAAWAVRESMIHGEPDWELLLAALEAELPGTMEDACQVIRRCAEYQFLPLKSLSPEDYAWHILQRDGARIPAHLQAYIRAREFGQRMIEETGPVQTLYGVVINRTHPIRPPMEGAESFRLFSSLTISAYGGPASVQPVIVSGQEAVSMQAEIKNHIARSLKAYGDSGLAELLSNRILARKVRCMWPDVEAKDGELWGVLKVDTVAALTDREKTALTEEWRLIAAEGWGQQLMYTPVRRGAGEVYVGFWDTERGSGLFIMPEEEFLGNAGHHEIRL